MDGFQTHLTGLTTDEARCLFLVGQPLVAHRVGYGAPTRTARNKLLGAIPPALAEEAVGLSTWYLNDPDPWTGHHVPHGELRRLARSIQRRRRVEVVIGHDPAVTVQPLGLVLKAESGRARRCGRRRRRARRPAGDAAHESALHATARLRPGPVLGAVGAPPRRGALRPQVRSASTSTAAPTNCALKSAA
jgi:hypothetical protein